MVKGLAVELLIAALISSGTISYAQNKTFSFEENHISVLKFGTDDPQAFCKGFNLSAEQVAIFFGRADRVGWDEIHNNFDWLPCYVKGTLFDNGTIYKWEIRAIGIGSVITPDDEVVWFGCQNCNNIFPIE